MSFRDLLKQLTIPVISRNYQNVVEVCGHTLSAVASAFSNNSQASFSSFLQSCQIQIFDPSKMNSLRKCDDFLSFSIYAAKGNDAIYYVIYVPRFLSVFHTKSFSEAEKIRENFNTLMELISFIERSSSDDKSFIEMMEKLQNSVLQHPGYHSIHHACICGFTDAVFDLCTNVEPLMLLNEPSFDGLFPLQMAVSYNHEDTLLALLNLGASISKQDCHGCSVLHYAAQKSYRFMEILSKYSSFKPALDLVDEDGRTPLCYSFLGSNYKCAELLLNAGCSKGPYKFGPLVSLLQTIHSSSELILTVETIMRYYPSFFSDKFDGSSTILHKPLDSKLLKHLFNFWWPFLDVNSANELGETPLHCCVRRGELSQVLSLLAHEAEVNAKDKHGNTALHFAVKEGLVNIVKLLLVFGADIFCANDCNIRPIDLCAENTSCREEITECIKIFTPSNASKDTTTDCLPEFAQDEAIDAVHAWLESNNESLVNVLSLDGGGIKGLVTLQILIHIQKRLESPIIDYFTWIAGTSTGAILALYFAKGETLESCRRLYLMLKDEVFAGTRPYPESKLESLLKKHFGDRTTFSQLKSKKVLITATSVTINPPKLELFRNYRLPLSDSENQKQGYKDPDDILVWKCARYSCAAPTYFSLLDGFADGGIIANNPTLDLLSDITEYNAALAKTKKKRLRLGCVLSLGTGKKPQEIVDVSKFDFRIPNGAFHGYNMVCGALKFMNILKEQLTSSDGECVRRARNFSHASQVPFFRFSPPLAQNVELDDDREETAVQCLWDTEKYLRTIGESHVISLVSYLNSLKNVITSETDKRSTVQVRHL